MGAVPVVVGLKGEKSVLASLDDGSSATMIEASQAEEIGLQGFKEPSCMSTMASTEDLSKSRNVTLKSKRS